MKNCFYILVPILEFHKFFFQVLHPPWPNTLLVRDDQFLFLQQPFFTRRYSFLNVTHIVNTVLYISQLRCKTFMHRFDTSFQRTEPTYVPFRWLIPRIFDFASERLNQLTIGDAFSVQCSEFFDLPDYFFHLLSLHGSQRHFHFFFNVLHPAWNFFETVVELLLFGNSSLCFRNLLWEASEQRFPFIYNLIIIFRCFWGQWKFILLLSKLKYGSFLAQSVLKFHFKLLNVTLKLTNFVKRGWLGRYNAFEVLYNVFAVLQLSLELFHSIIFYLYRFNLVSSFVFQFHI